MNKAHLASILICTRNRAEHLRQTLAALAQLDIPAALKPELIVIDNGSEDATAEVIRAAPLPQLTPRYISEPRRGQCHARNAGLAAATGDIILFTDDDVRLPSNWLEGMCAPILQGQAQGVAGGIRFAPHLQREWMQPLHRGWLASTADSSAADVHLIGANMAFAREVLHKVPAFDVELGPGALGFGDDTLFSRQLQQAGYNVVAAHDIEVEHHFEASRLTRQGFLQAAQARGKSGAYVGYHWEHQNFTVPALRLTKARFMLNLGRALRPVRMSEGIPLWEMHAIWSVHFFRQYLHERKRPHNYEKYGLKKRGA